MLDGASLAVASQRAPDAIANNRKNVGSPDSDFINTSKDYEVRDWGMKFDARDFSVIPI